MNNSTKLYDTLPLLPRHLDLFLLRPSQSGGPLPGQYLNDFKVNRSKIVQWLTFLKRNCPAYRNILIDANALSQLPEDGNVLEDILWMMIWTGATLLIRVHRTARGWTIMMPWSSTIRLLLCHTC